MNSKLQFALKPQSILFLFFLLFSLTATSQGTLDVSGNTDFGSVEIGASQNNTFVLDNTAGGGSPGRRLNNIEVNNILVL